MSQPCPYVFRPLDRVTIVDSPEFGIVFMLDICLVCHVTASLGQPDHMDSLVVYELLFWSCWGSRGLTRSLSCLGAGSVCTLDLVGLVDLSQKVVNKDKLKTNKFFYRFL